MSQENVEIYEGLREVAKEVWDKFTVLRDRFIDAGDQVLVLETVQGSGLGSGAVGVSE
ncbi:MAG: hypothetical protein QOK00_3448 [Thermoleophilaceae bacterium]|nr:hypothetical protein [Thermoleophilaceae bacterium]